MFINRLTQGGNAPLLEQMMRFTARRHELIAENVANMTTPNYVNKDLDLNKFQEALAKRVESRAGKPVGSVRFNDTIPEADIAMDNILFHDGNNRSAEQLMSDMSKNALMHNFYVELYKKQFTSIENALKERVG